MTVTEDGVAELISADLVAATCLSRCACREAAGRGSPACLPRACLPRGSWTQNPARRGGRWLRRADGPWKRHAEVDKRPCSLEQPGRGYPRGCGSSRVANLSRKQPFLIVQTGDSEGKRIGQRSDSKSDAPKGVVGSNPMPSAAWIPAWMRRRLKATVFRLRHQRRSIQSSSLRPVVYIPSGPTGRSITSGSGDLTSPIRRLARPASRSSTSDPTISARQPDAKSGGRSPSNTSSL